MARASREEAACLGYRFYADTEQQDAYLFVEEWESMDALREHFGTDHIASFMGEIFDAIVGVPDVQVHEVARTMTLATPPPAAASAERSAGRRRSRPGTFRRRARRPARRTGGT